MPKDRVSTDTLLQRLFKTSSLTNFFRRHSDDIVNSPLLHEYINNLCTEKDVLPAHVIQKSGIERTYGHQIFNGRKPNPSRDKVIQLAFGFGLNYDEIQRLLKIAHKGALYPKIKRDAIVIYALNNKMTLDDVQATLFELELPIIGGEGTDG